MCLKSVELCGIQTLETTTRFVEHIVRNRFPLSGPFLEVLAENLIYMGKSSVVVIIGELIKIVNVSLHGIYYNQKDTLY